MRGPAIASEGAGAGYNGSGNVWDHGLGGCESGFTAPDPADSNIVWSTCYGNKVTRYDHRTKIARSVAPGMITLDAPPQDAKYRCHWSAPLAIDPFDHNNVYYGCNVIFHTNSGGQSWRIISPDLSSQDPSQDRRVGRHRRRQPRPVRARGDLRDRDLRGGERADLGRDQRRQDLVHPRRRPEMERRFEERDRSAGVGRDLQDRTVALQWRHGLRGGRRAPDGQPRAVHLQDHRLRRDLETGQRRSAERAPAVVRQGGGGEPEQGRDDLRRHRPRLLLLDRRRRSLDRAGGRPAARAGELGGGAEGSFTMSRSRPTAAGCTCSTTSRRSSRRRRPSPTRPRTCSRRARPIAGRSAAAR